MHITQILYSGLGGHTSVAFSLIEADINSQNIHTLIFYGIEDMPEASVTKCRELSIPFFFIKKKKGLDRQAMLKIITTLKQIKPNVVLLLSVSLIVPVYYFSLFNRTKIIAAEHQANHLKAKMEWIWSYLVMVLAKKVVYLTDLYNLQMKKKLGIFYISGKVAVINNGINNSFFKLGVKKEDSGIIKIGMLSRLMNTKDHITLIRSVNLLSQQKSSLKKIELHIAGDGETKEALKEETQKLGLNNTVHFYGMIPEHESVDFINSLDIYVHASLGETMSTSIMQAMACGKPLVASDVLGINNMVINNINGLLIPAKNEQQLASAILQLLNNPQQAAELGHNAFTFAATHYSSKTMFDKYSSLF